MRTLRLILARADRLPLLLVAVGLVGAIVLFLAGVRRGFDFTDEGAYYLCFAHPEEVPDSHTSYLVFGAKLFRLMGYSLPPMRVCTLLAVVVGALVFFHGCSRFIAAFAPASRADAEHKFLGQLVTLTGSLLGFTISPPALSYNFQNAFCLLTAVGFLAFATAEPRGENLLDRRTLGMLCAFALFAGADFFVKFSSGIVLTAAGGIFYLVVSRQTFRQKTLAILLLLAGFGTIAAAYFVFFQSFKQWWNGLSGIARMITHGNYTTTMLQEYREEIFTVAGTALRYFLPVWVVVLPGILAVAATRKVPRLQRWLATIGAIWTAAHLLWLILELGYASQGGVAGIGFFIGTLAVLAACVVGSRLAVPRVSPPGFNWRLGVAAILLVALPYIGAFGTNNDINQNAYYQLAPWCLLAVFLLMELDGIWQTAWASRVGTLILAAVALAQFTEGYWMHPYRVATARKDQTVLTELGFPRTVLRLDPATHAFVVTARECLQSHGFKPSDDLLVFYDLPGFVFAMGGISPEHPWYHGGSAALFDDNAMHLGFVDPARRKRAFVVRNGYLDDSLRLLKQAGLNFPEGYELITPPMTSPFTHQPFEIWKPK